MTERLEKIPTIPGMGRSIIQHDERSKGYRAVSLLSSADQKPRLRHWRRGQAYDQGQTSQCVAFTGKGALNSAPMSSMVDYDVRSEYSTNEFYQGAQQNDEWEGEAYDGTSALGLLRYLKASGRVAEYRACFGLNDVLLTLSHIGPVMLGIWWYDSMFSPDAEGVVDPAGSDRVGGHEIEVTGIDPSERMVEFTNSWGRDWGDRGRARMTWSTLERLLSEEGDAYVITALGTGE